MKTQLTNDYFVILQHGSTTLPLVMDDPGSEALVALDGARLFD